MLQKLLDDLEMRVIIIRQLVLPFPHPGFRFLQSGFFVLPVWVGLPMLESEFNKKKIFVKSLKFKVSRNE
jgi:hypothetical protein